MNCREPIDHETLTAYWLGELPAAEYDAVESHYLGCAHCTGRLELVAAVAGGVRAAVASGRLSLAATEGFVDALRRTGLRVREYALGPGDSVNCTIRADDDLLVSRLRAPLDGVTRVDVVMQLGDGPPEPRVTDVPFDAGRGEVLLMPSAAWLRTMPRFVTRTTLIGVGAAGESVLGEYVFNHAPS